MKRKSITRIRAHEAGISLLELLTRRFTYHNRQEWKDVIHAGQVMLNQQSALPKAILAAGDTVEYFTPDSPEPAVDTRFSILFEDEALLVANKPGNLPCHPAGRYFNHTLWGLIKARFDLPYLTFVNRIDRETSGIVLLAKTRRAALICRQQFESLGVSKRYVALVEGEFPAGEIRASGYLAHDPESAVRKKLRFYPAESSQETPASGKTCSTVLRRIRSRKGVTQMEAIPETGRVHQIRATLSSLGYPVVGDKLYGVDDTLFLHFINGRLNGHDRQRLRLARQALHSAELHMTHPETGNPLQLTAPVPEDMQRLME